MIFAVMNAIFAIAGFHSRDQQPCFSTKTKGSVCIIIKFPEDLVGAPTWPPFLCLGAPTWRSWRQVKTENCVEKPEKFRTSTGFEPVTSRFRCDALTNWAMKPLTLGAGHLWVPMVPWGMDQWWNGIRNESYMNCGYEIKWSYDLRSYERNFYNCVEKPEAVHIWFISYTISSLIHSSRDHWNPQMTSSQRQWLHSSVG